MVYILLGNGFEEAEAIIPCDLLRRAEIPVAFAGVGSMEIVGSHAITVHADCIAEETPLEEAEMLVLPGGLRGVKSIADSEIVLKKLTNGHKNGAYFAAICAAPTLLASLGITDAKRAVCYPGMETEMGTAKICDAPAVTDGRVITGKAAGTSFAFALELITALRGAEIAQKIAKGIALQ